MSRNLTVEALEPKTPLAATVLYSAQDSAAAEISAAEQQYQIVAEANGEIPPDVVGPGASPSEATRAHANAHAYVQSSGDVSGHLTVSTIVHGVNLESTDGTEPRGEVHWREATTEIVVSGRGSLVLTAGFTANTKTTSHFRCCGGYENHEVYVQNVTGSLTVYAFGDFSVTIVARSSFLKSDDLQFTGPDGAAYDSFYADHGSATLSIAVSARWYWLEAYGRARILTDLAGGTPPNTFETHHAAITELNLPGLRGRGTFEAALESDSARFLGVSEPWGRTNEYTASVEFDLGDSRRSRLREGNILAEATYGDESVTDDEVYGRRNRRERRQRQPLDTDVSAAVCGYCQGDQHIHDAVFDRVENWLLPALLPIL